MQQEHQPEQAHHRRRIGPTGESLAEDQLGEGRGQHRRQVVRQRGHRHRPVLESEEEETDVSRIQHAEQRHPPPGGQRPDPMSILPLPVDAPEGEHAHRQCGAGQPGQRAGTQKEVTKAPRGLPRRPP